MPTKDPYQTQQRNNAIRQTFYDYLKAGLPRMVAYIKTAGDFYLSDVRVRDIVARRP